MEDIKPGTIAYMKTTEDPIFVLQVRPVTGFNMSATQLSGVEVYVRRPSITEKGSVTYSTETYFIEEIETLEDKNTRKVAEIEGLKAQFKSQKPELVGSGDISSRAN